MQDQELNAAERRELFIKRAVRGDKLWGLKSDEGWATAESVESEEVLVYPFWGDEESASSCSVDEWNHYEPTPIELNEFIESWCIGLQQDENLIGAGWNEELDGEEVQPVLVMKELIAEVKRKKPDYELKYFGSLKELEEGIEEIITGLGDQII